MAGSYVGLDIGSNLMKVAEVRKGNRGLEVTAMGVAATPPEGFENSTIVDPQLMGKAIKDLLKTAGISSKQCVSSISGMSSVVVRVIEVPQMSPSELEETMKWEVERHVPFAGGGSGVITDFVKIDRPEGYAEGQNMEVLLAAAQQDVVDRHVEMLFAAGLKPTAIDVEPLASGRTLLEANNANPQPGHTVAIVNIGASVTEISIYRDKLLTFTRTLPQAGDNFTRAIADMMQVDLATAERYKREVGEVMLDQFQQPQQPSFGAPNMGGGFMDFGQEPPPPTSTTEASPSGRTPFEINQLGGGSTPSSPSGRMPFDFSTPGQDTPAPGGTDLTGQPFAPSPFDAQASPSGSTAPAEPGFFSPSASTVPAPSPNLPAVPAPVQSSDPARDALRHQVFGALSNVLVELVQELRRSLDYFRSRAGDAPIHEMLLVGGSANLRNLAPFLETELGVPTRVADLMQSVQVSAKSFSPQHLEEVASLFPVCIGLGARDLITVPSTGKSGGKKRR